MNLSINYKFCSIFFYLLDIELFSGNAHITLTYPQARYPLLDFLDTVFFLNITHFLLIFRLEHLVNVEYLNHLKVRFFFNFENLF